MWCIHGDFYKIIYKKIKFIRRKKIMKKAVSLALALVMCLSLIPLALTASAYGRKQYANIIRPEQKRRV